MKKLILSVFITTSFLYLCGAQASEIYKGNETNQSFNKAKRAMEEHVIYDRRVTLYCQAPFDSKKFILLPKGFVASSHLKRAERVEWEHVVPAENFGRFFREWREGSPGCVDNKGRAFKGRKCAEKANVLFRYMQSDMYNLYPSIGAVNAERGNKNFEMLSGFVPSSFGSCEMKIAGNKAEPPKNSRGVIARTYKYMNYAYPIYRMSSEQTRLMDAWDKQYPIEKWECVRAKRIERIQGNQNPFVKEPCLQKRMW